MSHGDLPYAFCRHATSKIQTFEDLFKLHSYGFRGEALASIASTSKLSCQSIQSDQTGGKIEIEGGRQISHSQLNGGQHGTSIFVRDLFFNTPARLKFIRSSQVEKNSIKRILNAFIIANPSINFSIKWDDLEKTVFRASLPEDTALRIKKVFYGNKKSSPDLIQFEADYEGTFIKGFISKDGNKSNSGKHHYLFANNRLFNDKGIHQTVLRNSKRIWGDQHIGHYAIFISTPPSQIDVNVHPNKIQVKFLKSSMIFSLLSSALKSIKETSETIESPSSITQEGLSFYQPDSQENRIELEKISLSFDKSQSFIQRTLSKDIHETLIFGGYAFLKSEGENFILNLSKLYWFFWEEFSLEKGQCGESAITPLMIGEPFQLSETFDIHLEYFQKRGIELERISDEILLLKSVPQVLSGFNYLTFFTPLITMLISKERKSLDDNPFSNRFELDKLLRTKSNSYWQQKSILKQICREDLDHFFNSINSHE